MLNIEKYKDAIINAGFGQFTFDGKKISTCEETECEVCEFFSRDHKMCDEKRGDWLCEEYKEPEIDWDNEIDWERVPIDTEVEVINNIIGEWEKAFFLACFPSKKSYRYAAFSYGKKRDEACDADFWKYCRLVKIEDIEKYRKRG